MDIKITSITPLSGTHRLHVVWDNDDESIVNFKPIIDDVEIMKPLEDLNYFSKAIILYDGWVIGWPGNIDFAADNLWTIAQEQSLKKAS